MNSSIGHKIGAAGRRYFAAFLSVGLLGGALAATVLANPAVHPAGAAANAVVPDSSITGFTPTQFPANDDGTYPCGGSGNAPAACTGSDTGPATVPLGFNINFFGTEFGSAYVNNNGNITFSEPLSEYTPADLTTFGSPIIAPFFADVDTRIGNTAEFGTGTLNGHKVFVVNWPGVGCYSGIDNVTDDFQLILIDRADRGTTALGDDFDMEFNYNSIQWDTGTASSGDSNCENAEPLTSAYAGYTNGTATTGDSFNIPGSGVPNAFLDSTPTTGLIFNDLNSTTLGRYLFTVINGQPTAPTSLATSLSGGGQSGASISVPGATAVTDAATLSGADAATATGTVTYSVYSDSSCSTSVSSGSPLSITTPGTLPSSAPVTLSPAGTYYWQAIYSGDSSNNGSTSNCGSETETVAATAATPTTLSTSLSGGSQSGATISVPPSTAVTDQATLGGTNSASAGGTATYTVYSDSACTTSVADGGTVTVASGSVPASNAVSLPTPGTYYWQASYTGDSTNAPSKSTCGSETETVATPPPPATTTLSTSLSGGSQSGATISVPPSTAVTDEATLGGTNSATAGGTATYTVYSDSACTTSVADGGTVTVASGSIPASNAATLSTPGTYYWQASYTGDSTNAPSKSTCGSETETVTAPTQNAAPTTLTTTLLGSSWGGHGWLPCHGDLITVFAGSQVADSATLSGANMATAGGTVTYTVYSDLWHKHVVATDTEAVTDGAVGNSVPVVLGPGIYYWQASYSGDTVNMASQSRTGSEIEIVIPIIVHQPPPPCWQFVRW